MQYSVVNYSPHAVHYISMRYLFLSLYLLTPFIHFANRQTPAPWQPPFYSLYLWAIFFEFYFIFLDSSFLLVIYFIHISVYMSIPISQFIPPQPTPHFSPLVSIRLISTSVSLFLPCKPVHLYHFSRFHIYALTYDICFSLSDLLYSV